MAKRMQYAQGDLDSAVSAVKQKRLTVSQASRDFNIPRKTIEDTVKGRYLKHGPGPARVLSDLEESALVEYMKYMQEQGFPMTRAIARQYILALCRKSGKSTMFNMDKGPSDKWFRNFFIRYPGLAERQPERQDRARARMSNEHVIDTYFTLLDSTVKKLGLENEPGRIFNCDETGFSGKEKPREKVIGVKDRHFYQQALTSSTHVTLHMCIAADGKVLPSFVIFEKTFPHTAYKDGVPPNWMFAHSDSGYMDSLLFYTWFKDLFIPNCGKDRPVLLVMDNHDSHINLDIVKLARENQVELLGLPPHTTHILQPLDVSINGPLKGKFNTLALNLGFLNHHQTINKAKFPILLSHAIDQYCSPAHVKGAFRKSGLYPINKDAIDMTQVMPAKFAKPLTSTSPVTTSTCDKPQPVPSTSACDKPQPVPSTSTCGKPQPVPSTSTCDKPQPVPSTSTCGKPQPVPPTSMCDKPSSSLHTCDKCGSFLGGNPLVKAGLIPEELGDLFLPVASKPQTARKRKCITDARVISSDDFYKQLESRAKELEKRKEELQKRKVEREAKKQKKYHENKLKENKKGKGKQKNIKKIDNEQTHLNNSKSDLVVCEECQDVNPPPDCVDEDIRWIGCDMCVRWFHQCCVGLSDGDDADELYFICTSCSDVRA